MDFGWCPILKYNLKKEDKKGEQTDACLFVAIPVKETVDMENSGGFPNIKPVNIQDAKDVLVRASEHITAAMLFRAHTVGSGCLQYENLLSLSMTAHLL